ncbi:hypothetical protein M885DRAFT_526183 [Pelagophyceae sp. CCMP2097]|nr:hypothetical protein M885DRAFT_526183 [Pelagophyceae sp. CCMP2097]
MLPLTLLHTAKGQPTLIELKNGDTYNGRLVNADTWMNVNLEDVICTSRDGDKFWKLPECYIRGNSIKYLRIPDEIIDAVQEEEFAESKKQQAKGGRGAFMRGRGGRLNTTGRGKGRDGGKGKGGRDGAKGGGVDGRGAGRGRGQR